MSSFWKSRKFKTALALFASSILLFFLYIHLYVYVFKWDMPKTISLRRENAALKTRMKLLGYEMDKYQEDLDAMEIRDEEIYRSVFGLNSISEASRNAGFSGDYSYLDDFDRSGYASHLCQQADGLLYKSYVQSRSYDEIELMLSHADNMSSCIPAICPVRPDFRTMHVSSPFGVRVHPILRARRMHHGMDFSAPRGTPVYATGDGIVEDIKVDFRSYGRQIIIDHGFGYKSRYAHLNAIYVAQGMAVKRGDRIGCVGNTGRSTGPHLHYEVLYKGSNVNPANYYDRGISLDQYDEIIDKGTSNDYVLPMHRKAYKSSKTKKGKK